MHDDSQPPSVQPSSQPGAVISPGAKADNPAAEPAPSPVSPALDAPERKAQARPSAPPAPATGWQFKAEDEPATEASFADETDAIPEAAWTASEFIAHNKGAGWYLALVLAAAAIAVIIYWVTHDIISTSVVVLIAVLFGVAAARQPRVESYVLDSVGLRVGQKLYLYSDFKSFSILDEGAFSSIILVPLKRLAQPVTLYYAPEDEDKILTALSARLPVDQIEHDLVDRLMRRIHF